MIRFISRYKIAYSNFLSFRKIIRNLFPRVARFFIALIFFIPVYSFVFGQDFFPPFDTFDSPSENIQNRLEKNSTNELNGLLDKNVDRLIFSISDYLEGSLLNFFSNRFGVTILLIPILIIVIYLIGRFLGLFLLRPLICSYSKMAQNEKDRLFIESIDSAFRRIFIWLGVRLSIVPIESFFDSKISFLRNPVNAILIVLITILLMKIVVAILKVWGKRLAEKTASDVDDQLLPLVIGIVRTTILIFGFMFALSSIGINIAPILASLGAFSFALGFAVKDSLANFMAGIFMVLENTFSVGDKVDIPGIGIGFIHEIGLRTTKFRTFDYELIVIPNNTLMNKEYKNFRLPDLKIRVAIPFTVAYGSDIDQVRRVVMDVIDSIEDKLDDPPPGVDFLEMGDFSLNFIAKFYVDDYNKQYEKKLEMNDKLYKALNANKIEIPFPTTTIDWPNAPLVEVASKLKKNDTK